eukprot:341394_1
MKECIYILSYPSLIMLLVQVYYTHALLLSIISNSKTNINYNYVAMDVICMWKFLNNDRDPIDECITFTISKLLNRTSMNNQCDIYVKSDIMVIITKIKKAIVILRNVKFEYTANLNLSDLFMNGQNHDRYILLIGLNVKFYYNGYICDRQINIRYHDITSY